MRRVPIYTIIGNGRMAKHTAHYFQLLNIKFQHWHRTSPLKLQTLCENSTHILLLINDSAIDKFIGENQWLKTKTLIHFSGSLVSKYAYSAHPLMTFGAELYGLETYQQIPFILEQDTPSFNSILPNIPNNHFTIPQDSKTYYHSLCVMANNFTTILWQKLFNELEKKFKIPANAAKPYLQQTFLNLSKNYKTALTGPLARNDKNTIQNDLDALKDDAFQDIFAAFTKLYSES